MSDSRPGSATFQLALGYRFADPPRIKLFGCGYLCEGGTQVAGVGATPEQAYVDHVEEHWCLIGAFPPGYPD